MVDYLDLRLLHIWKPLLLVLTSEEIKEREKMQKKKKGKQEDKKKEEKSFLILFQIINVLYSSNLKRFILINS